MSVNNGDKATGSNGTTTPITGAKVNLADLIWRSAELLRGAFREPEYRRVILPFTVLRRLDCLLEPTKAKVIAKHEQIAPKLYDLRVFLAPITGFPFTVKLE